MSADAYREKKRALVNEIILIEEQVEIFKRVSLRK